LHVFQILVNKLAVGAFHVKYAQGSDTTAQILMIFGLPVTFYKK